MPISLSACCAVILAGGQSRRMGRCKALLEVEGETLIARLAGQLAVFDELWISANRPELAEGLPGRLVKDVYPGRGPLAGMHAAMLATKKEYLFCVSCDLPHFTGQLAAAMAAEFCQTGSAMACVDTAGRAHPLCGVYAKSAFSVIERRLWEKRLRMTELLEELNYQPFLLRGRFPDAILENVNTPGEFARALADGRGDHL